MAKNKWNYENMEKNSKNLLPNPLNSNIIWNVKNVKYLQILKGG